MIALILKYLDGEPIEFGGDGSDQFPDQLETYVLIPPRAQPGIKNLLLQWMKEKGYQFDEQANTLFMHDTKTVDKAIVDGHCDELEDC